jgi:hypothetical protein
MARLRSEFHFALNDLMVTREALGSTVEFQRGAYRVQLRIPADAKDFSPPGDDPHWRAIGGTSAGAPGDPNQRVNVLIVQVALIGEGPVGSTDFQSPDRATWPTDQAFKYFKNTFVIAEAVATELIDWARVRGQAWLGLHGERPQRVGMHSLIDEHTGRRLPLGFEPTMIVGGPSSALARAINPAFISSLGNLLGDGAPPLPVADTFLADALHFAWAHPPDVTRAVLLAAIACEVKVKEVLREKTASQLRPMVDLLLENPRDWSLAAAALFHKAMAAALGHSLKKEHLQLYKRIENLFTLRNGIAHRGEEPEESKARDVVAAAEEVFIWLKELPMDNTKAAPEQSGK